MESCLIADDHPLMREALAISVAAKWPATAIWEAVDYPSAWALAPRNPTLCLMDLGMPGAEPRDGIARMRRLTPAARILIITATQDDAVMLALLDDGVAGFVSKSANTAVIGAAIDLVLAGGCYLPPRIGEIAVAKRALRPLSNRLSPRQNDVLRLIGDGATNKRIARDLAISPATVKVHIAQLMAALNATNRTDAAMKARGLGLI